MVEAAFVIVARSLAIMVVLFVALRVLGKRSSGQQNVFDLVTLIAVANAVQNALTQGKGNLYVGFASALTLILVSAALGQVFARDERLERTVCGVPTVLVHNGRMLRAAMAKEGVSVDELKASLRGRGLTRVKDVRLAVLEVDGGITVVERHIQAR